MSTRWASVRISPSFMAQPADTGLLRKEKSNAKAATPAITTGEGAMVELSAIDTKVVVG